MRLRRDSRELGVVADDCFDLNTDDPGRRDCALRCLRHMCHTMGRFVQSMPPRGSKAEYAPRGTYDHVKSTYPWPRTTVRRSAETMQVLCIVFD